MGVNYTDIGKRIRKFRENKGYTQMILGEKAGVEPSNISHIERGATKVSLPTLVNIANALDVTLDEIVYGSLIHNSHISVKMINELLADCNDQDLSAIAEVIKTLKKVLKTK